MPDEIVEILVKGVAFIFVVLCIISLIFLR